MNNLEILGAIAVYGSVRLAAKALGVSAEAISKRFRDMPDDAIEKVAYTKLLGKDGRKRKYPEGKEGDRARWRNAKQKKQEEPSGS